MELQHVFSFPYMNSFSNIVFDKNNSAYFFSPNLSENNRVINHQIHSINTENEMMLFAIIGGVIDCKTFKLFENQLCFCAHKDESHTVYVYNLDGTIIWKKTFYTSVLDLNIMYNGNVAITTRSGEKNTIVWYNVEGEEIERYDSNFQFAEFSVLSRCVLVCTDKKILKFDFYGKLESTLDIGHTAFSLWNNITDPNNSNVSFVVTSLDSIFTVDFDGVIINKHSLKSKLNKAFFDKINMYGLNNYKDSEVLLMQNGFLDNQLVIIDLERNSNVAVFNSKKKFINTPVITQKKQILAFIEGSEHSSKCVIFDNALNILKTFNVVGEVLRFIANDDRAYVLSLDRNSNKISILSFSV